MKFGHCPVCGVKQRITHTRYTETSAIRRKKCKGCGARSLTYETYSEAEWTRLRESSPSEVIEQPSAEYSAESDTAADIAQARFRKSLGIKAEPMRDDTTPPELDDLMRQLLAKPKT